MVRQISILQRPCIDEKTFFSALEDAAAKGKIGKERLYCQTHVKKTAEALFSNQKFGAAFWVTFANMARGHPQLKEGVHFLRVGSVTARETGNCKKSLRITPNGVSIVLRASTLAERLNRLIPNQ